MLRKDPPLSPPSSSEEDEIRAHYRVERFLADRLRGAPAEERRALYASVYEELYRELEKLGLSHRTAQNDSAQVALMEALLAPFLHGVSTFVELGAGSGEFARAMAARVKKVYAVDAVEQAGDLEHGVQILGVDQVANVLSKNSIDLAFSCHLVEHLHPEDLGPHLAEVHRFLVPGGRYIVVTPNRILGPHDISKHFDRHATGLHLREYTHGDLARALRAEGFVRLRVLMGIARPPRRVPVLLVDVLERVLEALPQRLGRGILGLTGKPPLRALEQVVLVGEKRRRHVA